MGFGRRMRAGMFAGLVALVVLGVLGIAATTAPAGNRSPDVSLDAVPGPSEVTFGENVAYSARLVNDGTSMFTHVSFAMQAPSTTVDGETKYSPAPVYVSCDTDGVLEGWSETTHTYTCPGFGQVPSDPNGQSPVRVTLVWQTPTVAAPEDLVCDAPGDPVVTSCTLVASGEWKIKESQPGSNDTFAVTEESTLLVQPDPKKAAGYAVDECTDATTDPSVVTNGDVGLGNKVATAVCATSVPASNLQNPGDAVFDPGLVIEIDESGTAALPSGLTSRITEASFICIPEPGSSCPATPAYGAAGYVPWSFDDPDTLEIEKATFTFVIDNTQLPKGEKIDKVFHNGVLLPTPAGAVVADIDVNNKLKITTVTVESPTQGGWDFG
jgi:hypothetical protein